MLMPSDKYELQQIWAKYSEGILTKFDKKHYYNLKERHNDIGSSTPDLTQKQIIRRVRKYHRSIDAYIALSDKAA